jgi:trans-2-enoyl-CoA reductase
MIIEPRMRGFICLTSHPEGCRQNVKSKLNTSNQTARLMVEKVLVIGASTGFGLASRIASAFGSGAATIGVFLKNHQQKGKRLLLVGTILLLLKPSARCRSLCQKYQWRRVLQGDQTTNT